jgi:hypothetical protein
MGEKLVGVGETALTAVTGAVAPFIGVGAGMAENLAQGTSNRVDTPANAARFTYAPRTEAGQQYTENMGRVLDASKIPAYVPGSGQIARGMQAGAPGTGAMVSQAAQPVVNAGRAVGGAVADTAAFPVRAARGAFMNEPYTPSSAMVPLKETYYPQTVVDRFMKGQATLEEVQQAVRPTAELRDSPVFRMAEKILPKPIDPATGKPAATVALRDRASETFGERLMEGYTKNPLTFAADIGLPMIGVPPISPIVRGAQLAADKYISNRLGFAPGFIEKLEGQTATQQLRSQPTTLGGRPIAPTPPGPQWYPPGQVPVEAPPPPPPPPKFTEPVRPQTLSVDQGKAMIEQMRAQREADLGARAQQVMGSNYRAPTVESPVAPVVPTPTPTPTPTPVSISAPVDQVRSLGKGRTPLKSKEGQAAVAQAQADGVDYDITYKTSNGVVTETNKNIKFKSNPDLAITQSKRVKDGESVLRGTNTITGEPVVVKINKEIPDVDSKQPYVQEFAVRDGREVLVAEYDRNGVLISRGGTKTAPPKDIAMMLTDEQKKVWNALKLKPGPNSKLIQQLRDSDDPRAQGIADILEKRDQKSQE